ncbi:serine hydroxymethyltransferase [Candidatus Peribacteria bacterium]|nr:serine hydroxymethyltransferase [Candidatus Peribacteria bacterium]
MTLISQDSTAAQILFSEAKRQQEGLELIPSENYVSPAVLEALAGPFINKYAEGYPGRRYYGGQAYTDAIEALAQERACELFRCEYANVQPLSGANANLAAYSAVLRPGDTVLGMDLSCGGHLTHGHPVTLSAQIYHFVRYGIADVTTGEIDYDALERLAQEHRPRLIIAGYSSYTRPLDYARFVAIAQQVGALTLADVSHLGGLIAGGALPNPLDAGFALLTTTTHKSLRGPRGAMILTRDAALAKQVNKAVFPGLQGGPHMHSIAALAVALGEALQPEFSDYAHQVLANAKAMERAFHTAGVSLVNGGTDNHMLLIDVTQHGIGLTGGQAEQALEGIGLTVNKNITPYDPRGPLDPSGIRLGTPAMTTRGMGEAAAARIAEMITLALRSPADTALQASLRAEVMALCARFPLPTGH